jgi:SAM-dependent methyltransferase
MKLAEVFSDAEVARLYRYRPPYPDAVFATMRKLLVEPRRVLDAGAGTGALAIRMAEFADRVDAVDPSEAMVDVGRERGNNDPRIRWIAGIAEDAELAPPYGLITCGASLHWMDLDRALPRLRDALAPDAALAIVDMENEHGVYRDDVRAVIKEYSEIEHHTETKDLVAQLRANGRFRLIGEERTDPVPFEQSVDDYIHMLHSTSTLARVRLGDRTDRFDAQVRAVFAKHGLDRVRYGVVGYVAWGRPV